MPGAISSALDRCIATFGRVLTGGKLPVLSVSLEQWQGPENDPPRSAKMKTSSVWTGCVALAMATAMSDSSHAQIIPPTPEAKAARGEPVATRVRPELEPLGVRAGTFLIYPSFGVDGTYNDNVFATKDEQDDFITDLRPQLSVASDWANHALNLTAGADIGRYATYSRLNYEGWLVSADGRVYITRDSALFLGGGFSREHED